MKFFFVISNVSHGMRKLLFAYAKNNFADQLLCFSYIDSAASLLPESKILSL